MIAHLPSPKSCAVEIIIPTYQRPEALRSCLELVLEQVPRDGSVRVTVSDDSPDEKTQHLLCERFPEVRRVRGPELGPGANRNAGAREAVGDWFVFVDDDCLPDRGWLAAYIDAIHAAGEAKPIFAGSTVPWGKKACSLLWEAPEYSGENCLPPSCNFAIAAAVFRSIGGFDERYRVSFEDMDIFARLNSLGVEIQPLAAARVKHPRRPLPGARVLAGRWEARVISTLDLGVPPLALYYLLPRHVALVILSRFRNRTFSQDAVPAALVFLWEFLIVLWRLPNWIRKHAASPRSPFWAERSEGRGAPKRFGL